MPEPTIKRYANRPDNIVPVNLCLVREPAELLAELAPTRRAHGAYISRLLFEERVRQEERRRLRSEVANLLA